MTKASSIFITNFQRHKTSKQLSYRFRYKAISSHDQVEARKWRKYFLFFRSNCTKSVRRLRKLIWLPIRWNWIFLVVSNVR